MKLWLSRNTEVPLQEQLSAQLVMGMVSGDLAPVSVYPAAASSPSGFAFIRTPFDLPTESSCAQVGSSGGAAAAFTFAIELPRSNPTATQALDRLMADFLEAVRRRGHSAREIRERVFRWLSLKPPDHVLVIEPDAELRKILVAELQDSIAAPVRGVGLQAFSTRNRLAGAVCCALYDRPRVRAVVPPQVPCVLLRANSIPKALARERRPSGDTRDHGCFRVRRLPPAGSRNSRRGWDLTRPL